MTYIDNSIPIYNSNDGGETAKGIPPRKYICFCVDGKKYSIPEGSIPYISSLSEEEIKEAFKRIKERVEKKMQEDPDGFNEKLDRLREMLTKPVDE